MSTNAPLSNADILALNYGDYVTIDGREGTVDRVEYIEQYRTVTVIFGYNDAQVLYGNCERQAV